MKSSHPLIDYCLEEGKEKPITYNFLSIQKSGFTKKQNTTQQLGNRPAWGQNELTGLQLRRVISEMSKSYTMAQLKRFKSKRDFTPII